MAFKQTVSADNTVLSPQLHATAPYLLPRGSALITSSGNLANQGIVAIVHAASGAMLHSGGIYEPTLDSVAGSIENGFKLLLANGFSRMALPFVGGGAFRKRIGVTEDVLADQIVSACLTKYGPNTVIVAYLPKKPQPGQDPHQQAKLFRAIVQKKWPAFDPATVVVEGDLTSFAVHQAPVIMNPANLEVEFGGTLSGTIATATGQQAAIDQEAQQAIVQFWQSQIPGGGT